jgi:hypothetical protein
MGDYMLDFWTPCEAITNENDCSDAYFFAPETLTHHQCFWDNLMTTWTEARCTGPAICGMQEYPSLQQTGTDQLIGPGYDQGNQTFFFGPKTTRFSKVPLFSILDDTDVGIVALFEYMPGNVNRSFINNRSSDFPEADRRFCGEYIKCRVCKPPRAAPRKCALYGNDHKYPPCFTATCHSPHCTKIPDKYMEAGERVCCPVGHTSQEADLKNGLTYADPIFADNSRPNTSFIPQFLRPKAGYLALQGDRSACGFFRAPERCALYGNEGMERCGCSIVPQGKPYEFQTVCCPAVFRVKKDADGNLVLDDNGNEINELIQFYPDANNRGLCVDTATAPDFCTLWDHGTVDLNNSHAVPRCHTADPLPGSFGPSIAMDLTLSFELSKTTEYGFTHPVSIFGDDAFGPFARTDKLDQMYTCSVLPEGQFNAGRSICCPVDQDASFDLDSLFYHLNPTPPPRRVLLATGVNPPPTPGQGLPNGHQFLGDVFTEGFWVDDEDADDGVDFLVDFEPRTLLGDGSACSGPQGKSSDKCSLWGNPELPICPCGNMHLIGFLPLEASGLVCAIENFPEPGYCEGPNRQDCCGPIPFTQPCGGSEVCCPPGMLRYFR